MRVPAVVLERAKLSRVGVDVGVEADERGPVPAGPDREHGVEGRGGLIVALQGEQAKRPELVQGRVVGQLRQGGVGLLEARRCNCPA